MPQCICGEYPPTGDRPSSSRDFLKYWCH
uniref:Oligouridylate-binding protein 1-like isoform X2 n=1 Tax=Rhizophora mucronata TaxID=61149 RepID=A0A2P2M1L2_RHIMU